jgi:hypothetical protein
MAKRGRIRMGAGHKSKSDKLLEAGFVAPWFTIAFQEIKWKSTVPSSPGFRIHEAR